MNKTEREIFNKEMAEIFEVRAAMMKEWHGDADETFSMPLDDPYRVDVRDYRVAILNPERAYEEYVCWSDKDGVFLKGSSVACTRMLRMFIRYVSEIERRHRKFLENKRYEEDDLRKLIREARIEAGIATPMEML